MEKNIEKLIYEFERIKRKSYIESVDKGNGSVGLTFEKELGKKVEKSSNPDYLGIEIKVKKSTLYKEISLFNLNPNNPENAIETLLEKYGYSDKEFKNFKVFNQEIYCRKYNYKAGKKYAYKLNVDRINKKIRFAVYDDSFNLINEEISWDFINVENRLKQKLSYLAIINANRKYELNKEYFQYTDMTIYQLRDFEKFLELLEKDKIKILFKIGVYKDTKHYGEIYNHGVAFCIKKESIEDLFKKILVTKGHRV